MGVFEDGGEEFAGGGGDLEGVLEEGFDVAGDGGERGAQLVGDVGDEVAAGLLGALDLGDVVEDGDGSAIGSGRGIDFEDAGRSDRGGFSAARLAVVEGGLDAGQDLGIANGVDEGLSGAGGAGGDALHDGIGPADAAGGVNGDDGFLHAVEQGGELALLGFEGAEAGLEARGGGVEGVGDSGDLVERAFFDAGGEVSRSDAVGEGDDALEAGGSAMGEEGGEDGGQGDGDERDDEQVALQDVHGGVDGGHRRGKADNDVVLGDGDVEGVSALALAEGVWAGDGIAYCARNSDGYRGLRCGAGEDGAGVVEEGDLSPGVGFAALGELLQLGMVGGLGLAGKQARLAGERLGELIAERILDNAAEREVEYGGADGEHQHEREEELGEDSAGHKSRVQGSGIREGSH